MPGADGVGRVSAKIFRIGLISDTHGLLRPQALQFLAGCDHIVHAGDIGDAEILDRLAAIAPLTAVAGNNDTGPWAAGLQPTQTLRLRDLVLFVIHDLKDLPAHAAPPDARVVVCGHSHKPLVTRRPDGVLVVNPGSAGPRRFKLPVSLGELTVDGQGEAVPRLVQVAV
jgi:putative phosphoesterase